MKKEVVHFLHIGKTGGTALRVTLKKNKSKIYDFKFHKHKDTLEEIPEGEKVVFLIRDPTTRFISGFYSRKRKGRPRYKSSWRKGEYSAFKKFETANKLAESLSSKEPKTRDAAIKAMKNILHVKSSFWDWFKNKAYLKKRSKDILFLGHQENLNKDFEKLKKILSIPKKASLPTDRIKIHKNPKKADYYLSKEAKKNLKEWYKKDYQFLRELKKLNLD